ncbi:phosphopantetheine-binding protein [Micromonospora sp. NPDC005172]|uniref:phosphopantetheine-binding protein n=1 Tax=Micromonospora sp. NPDC005172 TaxID=3156867 RepID=UPI0033AC9BA2
MTGRFELYESVKAILVNDLQLSEIEVTPKAKCADIGLDSLAVTELAAVLWTRLKVEVADYELLDAATVEDVVRLIEGRTK